jgi:hypothetical protein
MKAHKDAYASLDTSNPYADMENKFEDLTISQKQALFEKQRDMQIQANTLDTARKSSGSSGTAAVAQALANQGKKSSQKSSASVGAQERQNQLLAKQEAARLQLKERQGEILSRKMKKDKTSTLLGMSQQEVAAQREKKAAAKQAKADVLASGVNSAGSMVTGGWAPFTQLEDRVLDPVNNPDLQITKDMVIPWDKSNDHLTQSDRFKINKVLGLSKVIPGKQGGKVKKQKTKKK